MPRKQRAAGSGQGTGDSKKTNNRPPKRTSALGAALAYAERGWRVFPLHSVQDGACSCSRQAECESPGKHPRTKRGFKDASRDEEQIRRWWSRWPHANIGIATGNGLAVLDIDNEDSLKQLLQERSVEMRPKTPIVRTGRGWHYYFSANGIRSSTLAPGVELKGEGKYVVAPPSLHLSGKRYRWSREGELAELPESLTEARRSKQRTSIPQKMTDHYAYGALLDETRQLRRAPQGERHHSLARAAFNLGQLVGAGALSEGVVETQLLEACRENGMVEEGRHDEVERTIHDGLRKGKEEPRPVERGADLVQERLDWLRANDQAKDQLRQEKAAASFELPPSTPTLREELAQVSEPLAFTIDGLHPTGSNSLLTAQYKTGKTTLLINLLQSLVDGEPFLQAWEVKDLAGRAAFWNYELTEPQMRDWLKDVGIANLDRGSVWNLRGWPLPLTTPHVRDLAVDWLLERDIRFLIVDPFRRSFSGAGNENSNEEVGQFLDTLDVIKRRANVPDLVVATHTGRQEQLEGAERARGATVLDDWADSRWVLVKDKDERFFYAEGRDVSVPEGRLVFDPASRRLRAVEGEDRRSQRVHELAIEAYDVVKKTPGIGKRELLSQMQGRKEARGDGVAEAIAREWIERKVDDKGHHHHYPKKDPRRHKLNAKAGAQSKKRKR